MRVTARYHQGEDRKAQLAISALPLFQQHGMDVPFQVIHRDQRLFQREGQSLGIAHATSSAPASPGPWVTAIASMVWYVRSASSYARRTTGTMPRRCSREASSGTTPPYGWWVANCENTTFDAVCSPERTTAAAVSSQELSMPRM